MRTISGEFVDYGVDWITATGASKKSQAGLQSLGNNLLHREQSAGNELRPWGFAGYEGFKCGSVQIGTRHDSTCIRLSSGVAFDHWLSVYHAGENFTRLDLQTTMRMERDVAKVIPGIYRRALTHSRKSKRGPIVNLLRSSNGSATIYFGNRESERFGRIYDKGRESKLDHYQNCLRCEEEIKGAACLPTLRAMAATTRPIAYAAGECSRFFTGRGVHLATPCSTFNAISVPRKRSDFARRLAWLRTQVAPSVSLLIAHGLYDEVVSSLNLSSSLSMSTKSRKLLRAV